VSNALRGNTFGIPENETVEDAIQRQLALIPLLLQVIAEAQPTITRLRELPAVSRREAIEAAERKALGLES